MKYIKSVGLLGLLIAGCIQADEGGAAGSCKYCVTYLTVRNKLPVDIDIEGYLRESYNPTNSALGWARWEQFSNLPAWTRLGAGLEKNVATINDRSILSNQTMWQFYIYHLDVMTNNGAMRLGFTIPLGWPQRKLTRNMYVDVKRHPFHEAVYPGANYLDDYFKKTGQKNTAVQISGDDFVYTVTKTGEEMITFDTKAAEAYGKELLMNQFTADRNTLYDSSTSLDKTFCSVQTKQDQENIYINKSYPDARPLTKAEFDEIKRDYPTTYELQYKPIPRQTKTYTIRCHGTTLHPIKTITAELVDGPVYTADADLGFVTNNVPTDPRPNSFAG